MSAHPTAPASLHNLRFSPNEDGGYLILASTNDGETVVVSCVSGPRRSRAIFNAACLLILTAATFYCVAASTSLNAAGFAFAAGLCAMWLIKGD